MMQAGWPRAVARLVVVVATLGATVAGAQVPLRVASPDRRTVVTVAVTEGRLGYAVERDGRQVITPSGLGFAFRGAPTLRDSLRVTGHAERSHDETWTQPWGEVTRVRDHHNEMRVDVA